MSDERPRPTSELGPSGPVSDDAVLAALARAEIHSPRNRRGIYMSDIAHHLGWRFSGAATLRLRPHLAQLGIAGLVDTEEPPPYKRRTQRWATTAAGRRRLASDGPVELPESPLHRRWRQDRDVATWALDSARAEAEAVIEEAHEMLSDGGPHPLTDTDVHWFIRRFEKKFKACALAIYICEQWPEPTDEGADESPDTVTALLPDIARKRRD